MPEQKTLTEDEKAEIRRAYRLAKDKEKQVEIFCDLYLQERETILQVLGLERKKRGKPETYSAETRARVLRGMEEEGLSCREAEKKFGIPRATIARWKKQSVEGKTVKQEKKEKQAVFTPLTERVLRKLIADGKSQRRYLLENALLHDYDLKGPEEQLRELLKAEKELDEVLQGACNDGKAMI